jgi:hypothetical protein
LINCSPPWAPARQKATKRALTPPSRLLKQHVAVGSPASQADSGFGDVDATARSWSRSGFGNPGAETKSRLARRRAPNVPRGLPDALVERPLIMALAPGVLRIEGIRVTGHRWSWVEWLA